MANNRQSTQVRSYQEAAAFLERGRYKSERTLTGRSTVLRRIDEHSIAVRYHATDVVTFHDDGRVTLNSGGFRTMTTKDRMSTYAPIRIAQERGLWYVWDYKRHREGVPSPIFFDGIECDETGALVNALPVDEQVRTEAAKRQVDRLVSRFIKGFEASAREAGELPEPGAGDCWLCMGNHPVARTPIDAEHLRRGPITPDPVGALHLLGHLEEGYYFGTLLYNAIDERGYGGGVAPIWYMTNADIKRGRADLYHLRNSLRQYFRARKAALTDLVMAGGLEVAA